VVVELVSAMSVREEQVEAAVRFITNPAVKDKSLKEKEEFLLGKGLNQEEIDEAVRRNTGGGSSGSTSRERTPSSVPVAGSPPPVTLPGGYPAPPGGMAPGGYAPPAPQVPPPSPGGYGWQHAPPLQMQVPFPQQLHAPPPQANSSPWWTLLLGGLSFGSLLALLINLLWPRRPPQGALELHGALPNHPHRAAWMAQSAQVSGWPSSVLTGPPQLMLPPPGGSSSSTEPVAAVPVEGARSSPPNVARLDELAGYIRRHVEETREASSSLRRTLEQQQRLYQATLSDFQRRVEDAGKRKPAAPTPRIEIAPESMKMLKSLLHRETTNGACEVGRAPEESEALRHWFTQVEEALGRHLRDAPSTVEAKKSLQTLCLIVSNLVSTSGQQDKFREVNTASSRFREQLGTPDGGAAELLQLAGFERHETGFVFPSEGQNLEKAERVRDFLQASVRDCDQRWQESHPSTDSSAPEPSEAVSPPRPPWASSISSAPMVNGTSSNIAVAPGSSEVAPLTDNSAKTVAPTASVAPLQRAYSAPSDARSVMQREATKPAAPWLSSAMQRGLQQRGLPQQGSASSSSNGHIPAETGGETPGSTALRAVHPAESAGMEETQRAPG